jgi:tetratricopeptide (TPR) repeat protein
MSVRFRRRLKIAPGLTLNFNKNSVGLSLGVRGAHYTMNSNGRRTISAGIPGTGLSSVETLSGGTRTRRTTARQESVTPQQSGPPSPGFFAAKVERAFYAFLMDIYDAESTDTPQQVVEKAAALKTKHPALAPAMDLITFLHGATDSAFSGNVEAWGRQLWDTRTSVFNDSLVQKYFVGITPAVQITRGISTDETYNEQLLGFIWSEVLQSKNKYDEALAVLEEMEPDQSVAISIADIELTNGKFDEAIETTEDVENVDDATAMLLVLRGIAFREKKLLDASAECFKRALSHKSRSEGVRHRAHFERAETYTRMGKKAMAIKDLENILVDEPTYPEVEEKLAAINK